MAALKVAMPPKKGQVVGRPFPKGKSGNPGGSSKKQREFAKIGNLTTQQLSEVGSILLTGDRERLASIGNDPDASVLQVWLAGLIVNSMKNGDAAIFRAVLDRIVGKAKESVELTGKAGGPLQIDAMTHEQRLERIEALRLAREVVGDD